MELVLRQGRWTLAEGQRQQSRPRLTRALEWMVPWGVRLVHGGYFHAGVERPVCRAIHRAARRGTLYRFAPPPPLRLVGTERGGSRADEYRFRSPFVSHQAARNEGAMRHYRSGAADRPLVVWNHGTGACARVLEHLFVARLLAAGLDVAVPVAPGVGLRRDPVLARHWAATVGSALSAIVQLVHDNVAIESWARGRGYRTVTVSGIGIGGTVAALVAATTTRFDACVPMLTGPHPGRLLAAAAHPGAWRESPGAGADGCTADAHAGAPLRSGCARASAAAAPSPSLCRDRPRLRYAGSGRGRP